VVSFARPRPLRIRRPAVLRGQSTRMVERPARILRFVTLSEIGR